MDLGSVKEAYFLVEISAKELFVKDQDVKEEKTGDFMLGAKASPSGNPNSYPMTDEKLFPSKVTISIDGKTALTATLADDPADHRGILSWHHQLKDRKLKGSWLVRIFNQGPSLKSTTERCCEKWKVGDSDQDCG